MDAHYDGEGPTPMAQAIGFDLNASPGFLVAQLSKRMTAAFNARLAARGLTTSQWAVLAALWQGDGLTQIELSGRTGIDAATLTVLLKRMAAHGLVRRERDERNNRYQRVSLTSNDTELREAVTAMAIEINDRTLRGFTAAERTTFHRLLRCALTNLASPDSQRPAHYDPGEPA